MASTPLQIAIIGAAGRMGSSLLKNAAEADDLQVVLAVVRPDVADRGPIGPENTPTSASLSPDIDLDVVIDFSAPAASLQAARVCASRQIPFVSGTTGFSTGQLAELKHLSQRTALLHAANFSIGVNLLADLVERISSAIGDSADIEIFEAHHRNKIDAPSGTAMLLGEAAAQGRDLRLEQVAKYARQGHTGPRSDNEIGFQVLRGGDIVGEHTVFFCSHGERLELTHRATDRGIFARGALRAARWIAGRPAKSYSMNDVLFHG